MEESTVRALEARVAALTTKINEMENANRTGPIGRLINGEESIDKSIGKETIDILGRFEQRVTFIIPFYLADALSESLYYLLEAEEIIIICSVIVLLTIGVSLGVHVIRERVNQVRNGFVFHSFVYISFFLRTVHFSLCSHCSPLSLLSIALLTGIFPIRREATKTTWHLHARQRL